MVKFGGNKPNDPYEPIGPQGFPMQLPNGQLGPGYSPGTIRNTLGSGLKASGIFQKDGHVQNMRGGFIGTKQPPHNGIPWQAPAAMQGSSLYTPQQGGYPQGQMSNQAYNPGVYNQYAQIQPRQLILQPAQEGINGNGVATISPDNSFLMIGNLPPPQTFLGQGQMGVYASYLVDDKGRTGFLAGVLRPVGNGVYRAHFQSQVPLHNYSRVVVSVENPAQLGQAPNGPIILKVKEPMGMMSFLNPMKKTASTVWGKISGLFGGGKTPPVGPEGVPISPPLSPEAAPITQELVQPFSQVGVPPEIPVPSIPPVNLAPPIPPAGLS